MIVNSIFRGVEFESHEIQSYTCVQPNHDLDGTGEEDEGDG